MALATLLALLVPALLAGTASANSTQYTMVEAPNELLYSGSPDATLDQIKSLGADGIRIQMPWSQIAPSPTATRAPSFNATDPNAYPAGSWDRFDNAINGARARGLKVQVTLTGPAPAWATPKHDGLTRPDPTAFGKFATAVGRRYGSKVAVWSVWNEPNLGKLLKPLYSGKTLESAAVYRNLYLKAYTGLRNAGVRAPILIGELAPQYNPNRSVGTIAPLNFMRAVLCLDKSYRRVKGTSCAKVPTQGFAIHPYSTQPGPFYIPLIDRDNVTIGVLSWLTTALDKAARAGAIPAKLPVYITEFGVQSFPDRKVGVPLPVQSDYRSIAERIAYENPRVKSFSQYLLHDDAPTGSYSAFESGLFPHIGDTPKPAFYGFRLPLVVVPVRGSRTRATLWGLVRPAKGAGSVSLQYSDTNGSSWKTLGSQRFSASGYWRRSVTTKPGRQWRVTWKASDGTAYQGSATHEWTRQWVPGQKL
ncbi:MAG TPA: cellulase family glycosylhydrolase [Conexibacter sp.]|jgi:hypothetical protein